MSYPFNSFPAEEAISIETEEDIFWSQSGSLSGGNSQVRKEVALTFDDAPSPFTKEELKNLIIMEYQLLFSGWFSSRKVSQVARQIVAAGL